MNNNNHCPVILTDTGHHCPAILTDTGPVIIVQPYLLTQVLSSLSSIMPKGQEQVKPPSVFLHVCEHLSIPALHSSMSVIVETYVSVVIFNWYELFLTLSLHSSSHLRGRQRDRPERGNMGETETRETEGFAIQIGRQTDTYKQ